jgi:hypothetical protein
MRNRLINILQALTLMVFVCPHCNLYVKDYTDIYRRDASSIQSKINLREKLVALVWYKLIFYDPALTSRLCWCEVSLWISEHISFFVTCLPYKNANGEEGLRNTGFSGYMVYRKTVQVQGRKKKTLCHLQLHFLGVDVSAVDKILKCPSERKEPVSFIIVLFFIFSGSAAQRGLRPPHSRGFVITHNDVPQSVGFLWTSDQLVSETSTWE